MPQIRPSSPCNMTALTVGVVGDEVEQCHPGQPGVGLRGVVDLGEVVLLEVGLDKALQWRQGTVLADHRGRDEAATQRFAEQVGGAFALGMNG